MFALLASSALGLPMMLPGHDFSGHCKARTDCIAECKDSGETTVMSCMLTVCPKSMCSARSFERQASGCWDLDGDEAGCRAAGCVVEKSFMNHVGEVVYCNPPSGRGIQADARGHGAGSVRCDLETTCGGCKKDRSHAHCAWVEADSMCTTMGEAFGRYGKTWADLTTSASQCPARGVQEMIAPSMRGVDEQPQERAWGWMPKGWGDIVGRTAGNARARGLEGYEEDRSFGFKKTGCRSRMGSMCFGSISQAKAECDADAECGAIEKPFGGGYCLCNGSDIKEQGGARVLVKIAAPSDAGSADDCELIAALGMCDMKINFGTCVGDLEMGSACCAASCA